MEQQVEQLIQGLVQKLIDDSVVAIFMKGSRVKDRATSHSDIDLRILSKTTRGEKSLALGQVLVHLVYIPWDMFSQRLQDKNLVAALDIAMIQEAKILYDNGSLAELKERYKDWLPTNEAIYLLSCASDDLERAEYLLGKGLAAQAAHLAVHSSHKAVLALLVVNGFLEFKYSKGLADIKPKWIVRDLKILAERDAGFTKLLEEFRSLHVLDETAAIMAASRLAIQIGEHLQINFSQIAKTSQRDTVT